MADPEDLLGDSDYLLSVTLHPVKTPRAWKLVILEDTGELLTADASARTGHALSRLLNVTDGMLGQGSNTLFLITTNEPLERVPGSSRSRPSRVKPSVAPAEACCRGRWGWIVCSASTTFSEPMS